MTDAVQMKPSLGGAIHASERKWGWFVALGVGELILGGIASTNLLAANLASVLVIGAAMLVAGIFQIVHGFSARGIRGFLFWEFGGLVYAAPGPSILCIPFWRRLRCPRSSASCFWSLAYCERGRGFTPGLQQDGVGSWPPVF